MSRRNPTDQRAQIHRRSLVWKCCVAVGLMIGCSTGNDGASEESSSGGAADNSGGSGNSGSGNSGSGNSGSGNSGSGNSGSGNSGSGGDARSSGGSSSGGLSSGGVATTGGTSSGGDGAVDATGGAATGGNGTGGEGTGGVREPMIFNNPVVSVATEDNADPEIMYYDGKYYMYPTTCPSRDWLSTYFKVYESDDLETWTDGGIILDASDVSWASSKSWAPAIQEKDGTFYFYFCMDQNIGVATSSSPTGPFADALGHPLVEGHIDPDVFVDDDGQAYLYYGQGTPRVRKLAPDMVSFSSDEVSLPTANFREGVYVFKRNDIYYMMGSENDARDATYQVSYSTGPSALGPFTKQELILQQSGEFIGTGHNSVIQLPGTDDWLTAYHRHFIPNGGGQYREICIQNMTFNDDGTIPPIVPGPTFMVP